MKAISTIKAKAIALGVNWTAVKLAFVIGVITGMLIMALAMVGKEATLGLVRVARAAAEAKL